LKRGGIRKPCGRAGGGGCFGGAVGGLFALGGVFECLVWMVFPPCYRRSTRNSLRRRHLDGGRGELKGPPRSWIQARARRRVTKGFRHGMSSSWAKKGAEEAGGDCVEGAALEDKKLFGHPQTSIKQMEKEPWGPRSRATRNLWGDKVGGGGKRVGASVIGGKKKTFDLN